MSSNLKGSTKQFGWLQAAATNVASLSITSQSLPPSEFVRRLECKHSMSPCAESRVICHRTDSERDPSALICLIADGQVAWVSPGPLGDWAVGLVGRSSTPH